MSTISLVIPTYDMSGFLPALWRSLADSGLIRVVREVIVVDDGSKDDTRAVLERLRGEPHGELLRPVQLEKNVGRFRARIEGARRANSDRVRTSAAMNRCPHQLRFPSVAAASNAFSAAINGRKEKSWSTGSSYGRNQMPNLNCIIIPAGNVR